MNKVEQNRDVEKQETPRGNPEFQAIFVKGIRIRKLPIDCDLTGKSLSFAVEEYLKEFGGNSPSMLVSSPYGFSSAKKCAEWVGRELFVICAPFIERDSWFIAGKEGVIFSLGV